MNHNNVDLFEQFVRLQWLLHRYHQQNHRYHGPMGDPHRGQGRVLALLKLKPEMSQKELSNILDIRSQSLGELLAKLERSGYITRTPSETDRRVMDIRLTEAGMQASEQREQQLDTAELFASLDEEEQAALGDYLSRIISTLEHQLRDDEGESHFPGRPPFDGRGFGRHPHMRDDRVPFDGRGFDRRLQREDVRPPFDGRGFGRHPGQRNRPGSSDKE